MCDPSQPLENTGHEAFAREWAKGASAADAYRRAGYKADRRNAHHLTTIHDIILRKQWFQREAASAAVLSIEEKREFLALAVRTPLSAVNERSPLCQSAKYLTKGGGSGKGGSERTTLQITMVDKLKAIAIDDDLSSHGADAAVKDAAAASLRTVPMEQLLASPVCRSVLAEDLVEHEAMRSTLAEALLGTAWMEEELVQRGWRRS